MRTQTLVLQGGGEGLRHGPVHVGALRLLRRGEKLDPDRVSFIASLRVVRRQVTDQAAFSP